MRDHDQLPAARGIWDILEIFAFICPFLAIPVFIFGTALLQDELVDGAGPSWRRAAIRMAIPTGMASVLALVTAIRALIRHKGPRWAVIFAVLANAMALVIIIDGMVTAP